MAKPMVQKRHTAPPELWRWVSKTARAEKRSDSSIVREALYLLKQAKEATT